MEDIKKVIEEIWDAKLHGCSNAEIGKNDIWVDQINRSIDLLESGIARVAEKDSMGEWVVNLWCKYAIMLYFSINKSFVTQSSVNDYFYYDKIPLRSVKIDNLEASNTRVVPGAIVRRGSFVGNSVILMPSFVNIGAYIGNGTMIDTWSTVGSCAQIGKNCHISGGVGIAGILEPIQNNPVIIEDNCFIGARSEIAEGVIIKENSVISMGVYIGASTKILDRDTGSVTYGIIPSGSVVVPGSILCKENQNISLYCVVIVKKVDAKTKAKTSLNELLRSQ